MAKKSTKPGSILSSVGYLLRDIRKEDPPLLIMILISALAGVGLPFFGIYLPKLVLGLLESGADTQTLLLRVGGFVLAMGACYALGGYADKGSRYRFNVLSNLWNAKIFNRSLDINYKDLESPQGQARFEKAMGSVYSTNQMNYAFTGLCTGALGFFLYTGVLASLHPAVVALLILSSLLSYWALDKAARYDHSRKEERSVLRRQMGYLMHSPADPKLGKDARIYQLKRLQDVAFQKAYDAMLRLTGQTNRRYFYAEGSSVVVTLLRDGLAYLYLIREILGGRMAVADFVFYFGAIAGFSTWLSTVMSQYARLQTHHRDVLDIRAYLETEPSPDPDPAAPAPDPRKAPRITLENVCFAYEDGKPVLQNLSLDIAPGEKIALVGVNGAGKTTLVKLLCGFYRPDSGRILLDGVDITQLRRADLFRLLSVVFQDITILPYSVAENVAMACPDQVDYARVEQALRQAGLWDFVKSLPKGMENQLLHVMEEDDGVIPSGGQQQKLLLARALYKNASLLILDEPSAALDPLAESALYEQYHQLAQDKTALYISHRLASTRFCDRVIFLSQGKALESGSHEELMALGGEYAHMYTIQSHYYQDKAKEVAI